jgi:hypothetical protein
MRTTTIAVIAVSTLALFAPGMTAAAITDGLGKWEGSGTASELSGKDLGPFTVAVTRKSVGNAKVRADGKITLAGGREIVFWQEFEDHGPSGFSLVTNNGAGGGQCFANGMCQTFEQRADGHAFATTIVNDGADRVRIVVTELEQGKAVRFFQETLLKKP